MPVPFTKEVDMSYISHISPETLAGSNTSSGYSTIDHAAVADVPASSSGKLAAGLEVTIGLAMLSGLSLAFCTIAAGAF